MLKEWRIEDFYDALAHYPERKLHIKKYIISDTANKYKNGIQI